MRGNWWAWKDPPGREEVRGSTGCRGAVYLTSTIRWLKITPLILTYNSVNVSAPKIANRNRRNCPSPGIKSQRISAERARWSLGTHGIKSQFLAMDIRAFFVMFLYLSGGVPKERSPRRGRAEKRSSKRVFLESPFLLCPLSVFRCF